MKIKHLAVLCAAMLLAGASCQEKQTIIKVEKDINQWVYSTIADNYLWASTLPDIDDTDRTLAPDKYFDTYLRFRDTPDNDYSEDKFGDRFSYLEYSGSSTRSGIRAADDIQTGTGIGFQAYGTSTTGEVVYCAVTYVIPGSPAEKAGIRRGDVYKGISGYTMPLQLYQVSSLMRSSTVTLDIIYPERKSVTVEQETFDNNPVIMHTIFDTYPKVGYLVYNHFTPGSGSAYNNELNRIFAEFKASGVQNLILDLRYNPGGYVSTAIHLASLIAPSARLGEGFMYTESKNSFGKPDEFELYNFKGPDEVGAYNADIRNLIVLSTNRTASASELIIHGMKAVSGINTALIGKTTYGKNLGTVNVTNKSYEWEINPVTSRIYNLKKVSGYELGIAPEITQEDGVALAWGQDGLAGIIRLGDFGDTDNDVMLRMALSYMMAGVNAAGLDAAGDDAASAVFTAQPIPAPVPAGGMIFDRIIK